MPPVVLCIVVSYVFGEIALRFMGRRLNRTVGLVRFSVSVVSSKHVSNLLGAIVTCSVGLPNLVLAGCRSDRCGS